MDDSDHGNRQDFEALAHVLIADTTEEEARWIVSKLEGRAIEVEGTEITLDRVGLIKQAQ